LDDGVDQSTKTDCTKGSGAGALQAGPGGRSRLRFKVVGGKDARDGDMNNVGQDLREPVKGEISDNVQADVYKVGGSFRRKHLAESCDDDEDMDVTKYLEEETNKRQEKNGGRVSGNDGNFLQQHLLDITKVFFWLLLLSL
jgi:hypothetical protein